MYNNKKSLFPKNKHIVVNLQNFYEKLQIGRLNQSGNPSIEAKYSYF